MLNTILRIVSDNIGVTLLGAITLIQVAPIKINPWSWLAGLFHKFLLGEIDNKLSAIQSKVNSIEGIMNEREAVLARTHILRFNDELLNNVTHSNEYYLQTLDDIKTYLKFTEQHPEFANGRTEQASENIRRTYERLFDQHKL